MSVRVGDLEFVSVLSASGDVSGSFWVVMVSSFFKARAEPECVEPSGWNGVDVADTFPDILFEPAPEPVAETVPCLVPIPMGVDVSGCW